jgi:dolichol kinase
MAGARDRQRAEGLRKSLHLAAVFIPLAVWFLPAALWRWPLVALTVAVLAFDFLRLGHPGVGRFVRAMAGAALRRHEREELAGSSYLALGCLLAALLFPRPVAVAAMGYLILGDGLAGLIGRAVGRVPLAFGKSLEGTLAGFAANLLVGLLAFRQLPPALLGAAVASAVEFLPLPLDDNLAIPLISGTVLWWALL